MLIVMIMTIGVSSYQIGKNTDKYYVKCSLALYRSNYQCDTNVNPETCT